MSSEVSGGDEINVDGSEMKDLCRWTQAHDSLSLYLHVDSWIRSNNHGISPETVRGGVVAFRARSSDGGAATTMAGRGGSRTRAGGCSPGPAQVAPRISCSAQGKKGSSSILVSTIFLSIEPCFISSTPFRSVIRPASPTG
jgi:hypothetical protein